MKLTNEVGCFFNDRIDLELSPNNLKAAISVFKEKALNEKNYDWQGIWRELKDYFQERYNEWEKMREVQDK